MLILRVLISLGTNIHSASEEMCRLAKSLNVIVSSTFNDIVITAGPLDDPGDIRDQYYKGAEAARQRLEDSKKSINPYQIERG